MSATIFQLQAEESALLKPFELLCLAWEKEGWTSALSSLPITVHAHADAEGLSVQLSGGEAFLTYSRRSEFFRGMGILKEMLLNGSDSESRQEKRRIEHLTYMMDCSRNAVCRPEVLKDFIITLSLMGYDRMMLYTEDTYEIEGHPYYGRLRGRYTKEELKDLDSYADQFGIEMVPCIQTLAHLNAIFRWPVYGDIHDAADILLCGEEKTYELIEDMVKTYSQVFHSRLMNIGMDEAELVGRGSYLDKNGYESRFDVMAKHLRRVLAICEKYGYTCMMWSDMFFKIISGQGYYCEEFPVTDKDRERIPENVQLIYWDYYSRDAKIYDRMMGFHKELNRPVVFAGGAWKWSGFVPLVSHSMLASRLAVDSCQKHGIQHVIVTGWGDNGGEASQYSVLPVLSLYAEASYAGRTDDAWLAPRFHACTDGCYEDFLHADQGELLPGNEAPGRMGGNPCKYLLYDDPLLGLMSRHQKPAEASAHFASCADAYSAAAQSNPKYRRYFETLAKLTGLLAKKCLLYPALKEAYDKGDKTALGKLALDCQSTVELADDFLKAVRSQWLSENKAFGLEILEIRISGVKTRLESAALRIHSYLNGEISSIEELGEDSLPNLSQEDNQVICQGAYAAIASACVW